MTKTAVKKAKAAKTARRGAAKRSERKRAVMLDPVTLEVIRNALPAVANEMAADLQRTSYNMMIYEVRDFCTALVDPKGQLISQNVGGVSHFVADLGVVITDGMKRYGERGFAPGDVIITNHQAVAGQHLNNIVIYMPYFYRGELLMFAMVRAHWIDVGGTSTGFGAGPQVADPWFEGLQLDQLKIYREGELDETLFRVIKDNIRFPESSLGDMKSQMAACRLAARRMDELFDKYGRDTILAAIRRIFDETEQKCRNVVAQLPDGIYEASASIDDDGVRKDEPVPIKVTVTIKGSSMTIDLSGSSAERKAGINSRTLAGARVAYKALTGPLDPVNEGSFRALDVVIPEGNIMMARFPAPMAGWSAIVPTVVDCIVAALAKAMPDRVPAGHHGLLGGAVVFFGLHPKTGRRFVVQSLEGGGWGGRPYEDGESGTVSVCQGDVRNGSIEGIELKCPVLVESRALRTDSCGAGKYRGGLGIDMQVRNLVEGHWNFEQTRRAKCPPWGLWGGTAGESGGYLLRLPQEREFRPLAGARLPVPVGASAIVRTGGGGGWGDPCERAPDLVVNDVREELISRKAARDLYGVVMRDDFTLDAAATAALRSDMRAKSVRAPPAGTSTTSRA
ncbi:MAG TPA: hydantoinase B/oxoprolinase family protein [Xanthobacteraceae bacterium]|nr:hydantoinase B/oxoprolinase family protein [Xanthobacteraceae bacterium]